MTFKKTRAQFCLLETNLIKLLLLILLPFVIMASLAAVDDDIRAITPTFGCYNCGIYDIFYHTNYSMILFITVNGLFTFLFLYIIHQTKLIQPEFAIQMELITVWASFFITNFVKTSLLLFFKDSVILYVGATDYIILAHCFLCLTVTALIPIRETYSPNQIIPFPLNEECIKNLEMALLLPTSANYFYEYLEN